MATRINLLDWRTERRERRKKEFAVMMGIGAITAVTLVFGGWAYMNNAIANQLNRNDYLRREIAAIDAKIKEIEELERLRNNLLARMQVVEQLQASRTATVHFFDEVVNTLPEGVFLTSVKQQGQQVTIDGVAESNGRVSTYMKNLDASPWFDEPKLVVIKTVEKNNIRQAEFQLVVKSQTKPKEEGQEGDDKGVEEVLE